MKAIVTHGIGGSDVLKYEDVSIPEPKENEVSIKVHAATVNHTDIFHRRGLKW